MNIDYTNLERDLVDGNFRQNLEHELTIGFRILSQTGERLPTSSHYASQMAEIVNRNAPEPLNSELAYYVYQEILEATEAARATVLGEKSS